MANYNAVKDRQDVPIWNAIEANNFKQALKLVDKRLAKKPTDYLQVRGGNRGTTFTALHFLFSPTIHVTFLRWNTTDELSQALKIYIKSQSSSISERSQVLISLETLATRKPPITDIEAIDLYDEALGTIVPEQQESWQKIIGEMRYQSVKSAPKDEPLSRNCLKACLSKGDLDHARQVCCPLSTYLIANFVADLCPGCH